MKKGIQEQLDDKLNEKLSVLPEFVNDYLFLIETEKKVRTRIEYAKDIILFLEYVIESGKCSKSKIIDIEPSDLDAFTDKDILKFFRHISSYERTYKSTKENVVVHTFSNSEVGKSRKLATLRNLFRYLVKKDLVRKDITQDIKIKVDAKVKINNRLTPDDMERLFSTIMDGLWIENERKEKFHEKLKFRDYIMVLLLAYTGIRVSELVSLDIPDIHLENECLVVSRKGGDEEEIKMPKRILEDVAEYIRQRTEMKEVLKRDKNAMFLSLHKKRITDKSVRLLLKKYQMRSGIKTNITPHVFRRTFGTNHYNTYQDMFLTAQVLGHASAETTRKFYADPSKKRVDESMSNFDYQTSDEDNSIEQKLAKLAKKRGISIEELIEQLG